MRTFLRSTLRTALIPVLALAVVACDDDDGPTEPIIEQDIVEIAGTTPELSTLTAAVQAADLVGALQSTGPFTVFAPRNAAFDALPAGELDRLLQPENQDELVDLLRFHVVPGRVFASDISDGEVLPTLTGDPVTFSMNGGVSVNGASVVEADIEATNGVIHIVDGVLLPPQPSITELAAGTAELSTLVEALTAAGLTDDLEGEGPFTVFAPVNEAFEALGPEVVAALLEEGNLDLLTEILTFHVVPGAAVESGDLTDGQTVTTLQGEELTIGVTGDGVTVNGAAVVTADLGASNGVVHLVDGVLVPEVDIVERATLTASTQTLVAAVAAGGLVETLKGGGPFTVFAPVDAAFEALGEFTLAQLLDPANQGLLQEILTYHVIPGDIRAADLTDGAMVATVEGRPLTFDLSGETPRVNGAAITATDIVVSNGVIHLVDEVLVPELDIVESATITEQTSTLAAAVGAADLVETLEGEGPFTVFAPLNAAFEALGTEKLDVLLDPANQALLQKVLTYHVVPGDIRAADLTDGATVTTAEGSELTIDLSGETPRVNGAGIVTTDIETENGVIHLVDGVLTGNLDLVDVATVNGFSTLVSLVEQQELTATLRTDNGGEGFTVFAPTDEAFAALETVPEGEALTNVLLYHVVGATVGSGDLTDGQVVETLLEDATFTVNLDGSVTITDGAGNTVNVTTTDVAAANGVVHVVDAVLLPGS